MGREGQNRPAGPPESERLSGLGGDPGATGASRGFSWRVAAVVAAAAAIAGFVIALFLVR